MQHNKKTAKGWTITHTCEYPACEKVFRLNHQETKNVSLPHISTWVVNQARKEGWLIGVAVPIKRDVITERDDLGNPAKWGKIDSTTEGTLCPKHAQIVHPDGVKTRTR